MIKSREIDDIIKGIKGFLPFAVINSDPRNRVEKLLSYSANDIIPNSLSVMNVDGSARFTKLGIGVDPLSALTIDFDPSLQDGILIRDNRDVNRKTLINQAEGATYIYNTNVGTFGTEAIRILSDNNTYFSANVGIGTDSPSTSMTGGLHIKSTAGNSLILEKSSGAALQFRSDATTIRASIAGINGGDGLAFQTGAAQTERMRISSDGNVGIGVDSPAVRLDVRKDETVNFAPNNDQRIRAQIVARNNNETAENFSSISLVTGGSNQAEWSINNVYKSAYNGDLSFKTRAGGGNADWRERMRINNAGYVGIGTDNPLYTLDLDGGTTVDDRMRLNRGSDDTAQFMTLGWNNISVHRSNVPIASNQTSLSFIQVGCDGSRTSMFIDNLGQVGIGTTSPTSGFKLDVVDNANCANIKLRSTGNNVSTQFHFEGYRATGCADVVSRLETINRNSSVTLSRIDTNTESVYNSGAITFSTASTGTLAERVRITSAGQVGIGTAIPSYALTVFGSSTTAQGLVICNDGGGNGGRALIAVTGCGYGAYGVGPHETWIIPEAGCALTLGDALLDIPIKFISNGSETARFTQGNLGIGTSGPLEKLHIRAGAGTRLLLTNAGSAGNISSIGFDSVNTTPTHSAAVSYFDNPSDSACVFQYGMHFTVGCCSGGFSFGQLTSMCSLQPTTFNTLMSIKCTGYVGIGTAAPESTLHVEGGSGAGDIQIGRDTGAAQYQYINFGGNTAGDDAWQIGRSSNSGGLGGDGAFYIYDLKNSATRLSVDTSGNMGLGVEPTACKRLDVRFSGNCGNIRAGGIYISPDEDFSDRTAYGDMIYARKCKTSSGGYWGVKIENFTEPTCMQLYPFQYLARGAGTGDGAPNCTFMRIMEDGDLENVNNSYTGISDCRLKKCIVDAPSQWCDISQLRIRNFEFCNFSAGKKIGVIAQEAEAIMPGLVNTAPTEYPDGSPIEDSIGQKSFNYSILYMKAVKALQEAMERIELLEDRVAVLEAA